MISIFLYGALADQFGETFKLSVSSPAEACRALEANFPGKFYNAMYDGSYTIFRGDVENEDSDSPETLNLHRPNDDIHIVPAVSGAKDNGVTQIITGVIIIAAAVVYTYFTGDASTAAGVLEATFGGATSGMAMMGTAMILTGVSAMLTPVPTLDGADMGASADDPDSFIFSGAENVSTQGGPVPLVYGRFRVGSTVISRSLTVEDIAVDAPTTSTLSLDGMTFEEKTAYIASLSQGIYN